MERNILLLTECHQVTSLGLAEPSAKKLTPWFIPTYGHEGDCFIEIQSKKQGIMLVKD
jgi:hypothetical protein